MIENRGHDPSEYPRPAHIMLNPLVETETAAVSRLLFTSSFVKRMNWARASLCAHALTAWLATESDTIADEMA
jgi:hypothetical protein